MERARERDREREREVERERERSACMKDLNSFKEDSPVFTREFLM